MGGGWRVGENVKLRYTFLVSIVSSSSLKARNAAAGPGGLGILAKPLEQNLGYIHAWPHLMVHRMVE